MRFLTSASIVLAVWSLSGCNCGRNKLTVRCAADADCDAQSRCAEGACRQICMNSLDCDDACSLPGGEGSTCRNGMCLPGCDECLNVVCDMPPAPECDTPQTLRRYQEGVCVQGGCRYDPELINCTTGTVCRNASCQALDAGSDTSLDGGTDAGLDAGRLDAGTPDAGCTATEHFENGGCFANQRTIACPYPPNTVANTATTLAQTWTDGGWHPPATASYDPTPSTTECRYTCDSTFVWDAGVCTLPGARTRCVEVRPGGNNAADWYWILADGGVGPLRQTCPDVTRGINCSDRDGCCHPAGVSINGRCVLYANQGQYCYASPQCKLPLTCNSNVCVP